ncbi:MULTISPECIES: hypothetical protein [unclassified Roseofilum]|uniref:hypothetical protein n=1 Tax=unclassified Roseofilum TaxID=2620099 RepID=UPI001B2D0AF3|nr:MULTISPECIES: hypothetical protein [unclassified Roseofilum]MBP0008695.1 hypothetical protein [Roseofilum sp. Belize Diploria]MBP0033104.1 hypothetical protein [Roseofilum sp. Belize BBD 4]
MRFIEAFHRLFPDAEIAFICGDWEFIGKAWVGYLRKRAFCGFPAQDSTERSY